jgi:hypothetical protein
LSPLEVIRSTVRSTFSFSAHSAQTFCKTWLAPGTQWSQAPIVSLPAAWAPRTKGAVSEPAAKTGGVSAAAFNKVRRVRDEFAMRHLLRSADAVDPGFRPGRRAMPKL